MRVEIKNRTLQENPEESCLVPGIGQLSNSVLSDLLDFNIDFQSIKE